jgi:hypothetical protein
MKRTPARRLAQLACSRGALAGRGRITAYRPAVSAKHRAAVANTTVPPKA